MTPTTQILSCLVSAWICMRHLVPDNTTDLAQRDRLALSQCDVFSVGKVDSYVLYVSDTGEGGTGKFM